MFTRSRVTCSFSASLSACLRFRWYWVTNDGSSWRPISIPFAAWQAEEARHVRLRLRDGRHAAAGRDSARTRVVRREGERHRREAREQVVHEVALGVDRSARVERVAEAVRGGGPRHELRDAPGSGA